MSGAANGRRGDALPRRSPASRFLRTVAFLVVGLGFVLLAREGARFVPGSLEWVRSLGPAAAVAFVGLYAVATVAWIPGSLLTLASGAIFGLAQGTFLTLMGATLGAAMAFLVSRHLARGSLERRLKADARLAAMDEAVGREGARLIFLLRLSPAFPFTLMNYALGLTAVRFRDYVLASAFGMAPGTFMYVYAGYTAGQAALGLGGAGGRSVASWILLGVGLAATVLVTTAVTRIARRALRAASGPESASAGEDGGATGRDASASLTGSLTATGD